MFHFGRRSSEKQAQAAAAAAAAANAASAAAAEAGGGAGGPEGPWVTGQSPGGGGVPSACGNSPLRLGYLYSAPLVHKAGEWWRWCVFGVGLG